jgi:hypothetical protein
MTSACTFLGFNFISFDYDGRPPFLEEFFIFNYNYGCPLFSGEFLFITMMRAVPDFQREKIYYDDGPYWASFFYLDAYD